VRFIRERVKSHGNGLGMSDEKRLGFAGDGMVVVLQVEFDEFGVQPLGCVFGLISRLKPVLQTNIHQL